MEDEVEEEDAVEAEAEDEVETMLFRLALEAVLVSKLSVDVNALAEKEFTPLPLPEDVLKLASLVTNAGSKDNVNRSIFLLVVLSPRAAPIH